ncbi:MAG TPA: hypothetical protein VFY39_09965 [Gammaproteobacteria bacterium]|nr:hypothetical protein [Gammaproteobacteria bacterium]
MRIKILWLGAAAALLATPVFAQAPSNPFQGLTRFAGTVKKVAGQKLSIETRNGVTTAELADSALIMMSKPATMRDLGNGSFVGCTAVAESNGKLRATECHIFPESMRGTGEGHNPMGPPKTTMTNGNITTMTNGSVQTANGSTAGVVLHVAYKGGAQDIEVSPKTQVTQIVPLDQSDLKPGMKVTGAARKAPDGTAEVQILSVAP